ncbi:hypothetical protein E2320_013115, partial [Naja naja]
MIDRIKFKIWKKRSFIDSCSGFFSSANKTRNFCLMAKLIVAVHDVWRELTLVPLVIFLITFVVEFGVLHCSEGSVNRSADIFDCFIYLLLQTENLER